MKRRQNLCAVCDFSAGISNAIMTVMHQFSVRTNKRIDRPLMLLMVKASGVVGDHCDYVVERRRVQQHL